MNEIDEWCEGICGRGSFYKCKSICKECVVPTIVTGSPMRIVDLCKKAEKIVEELPDSVLLGGERYVG